MTRARLHLLGAALLFSTGGAAIKSASLSIAQVACLRSLVAAAAVLCLMPASRRLLDGRVWLVGAAFGGTMICFVAANKLTTAANTIYLQATAPLYVVLLSPLLLRERNRARDIAYMLALGAGLVLFVSGREARSEIARHPALGNTIAALAGLFWALTVIGLRWLSRSGSKAGAPAAVAAGNLLASVAAFVAAWPIPVLSVPDLLVIGWLGVFQIALAYVLLLGGIRSVRALEASLLLLLEPVLSPLWAFLVHGETPGAAAIGGACLILAATAAHAVVAARDASRP